MEFEYISETLIARHPELVQVNQALAAYYKGSQTSIYCSICDQPLTITYMEASDGLWVTCPEGCTTFRVRHSARRSQLNTHSAV